MYVCIYIYMYIHTYIHIYEYTYAHVYTLANYLYLQVRDFLGQESEPAFLVVTRAALPIPTMRLEGPRRCISIG